MTKSDLILRPETAADLTDIDDLLNNCFGPGRYARTAFRLREGVEGLPDLAVVAMSGDRLVGSLRYWPVLIEKKFPALLLGPLAVHPDWRGKGCGLALMQRSLPLAAAQGHRLVVLVGDINYYNRAGFVQVPVGTLDMPGPVDLTRLLWLELCPGGSDGIKGMIGKAKRDLST